MQCWTRITSLLLAEFQHLVRSIEEFRFTIVAERKTGAVEPQKKTGIDPLVWVASAVLPEPTSIAEIKRGGWGSRQVD